MTIIISETNQHGEMLCDRELRSVTPWLRTPKEWLLIGQSETGRPIFGTVDSSFFRWSMSSWQVLFPLHVGSPGQIKNEPIRQTMIEGSDQNVFLIQIDALSFAEFELSEFEISRVDCICSHSLLSLLTLCCCGTMLVVYVVSPALSSIHILGIFGLSR